MSRGKLMEADWLAIGLASESNRAAEWWPVGWVIRRRVEHRRHPNTYRDVILKPRQFSYFNKWTRKGMSDEDIFEAAKAGYAGGLLEAARVEALKVIAATEEEAPFGPEVLHYWSPVSMVPKGSAPRWAQTAKRTFVPKGIDPYRFVFAEGVK